MAASASAPAQPHPHSVPAGPPPPPTLDDLALQTCDDADSLNEVMRAYTAFEKLIEPGALNDSEALTPTRSELSALLRLLNEALVARIDAVNAAAGDVRRALQGGLPSAT
jgi:hypothetical protein